MTITIDAVGNRLSETTAAGTTSYSYDAANRLTNVNETEYQWDDNDNLLNDGTYAYTYDHANRLISINNQGSVISSYSYNGQGDCLASTTSDILKTYTLDLNAGLTQVLQDGTNTYVYGVNRIAQVSETHSGYFLTDTLGSVRQMTDEEGEVTLTQSYTPYGEVLESVGTASTVYAFTGEDYDSLTGLVYLRARYYDSTDGRFVSKDIWPIKELLPQTVSLWVYTANNPLSRLDPSGHYFWGPGESLLNSSRNRFQSQNVSVRVQEIAMMGCIDQIHAEYPIPPLGTKVDLLDSLSGEVWEIKPWADQNEALLELQPRLIELEDAHENLLLTGFNPVGMIYDWNIFPPFWVEGYSFPSEVFLGNDDTGQFDLYAGQPMPGVIVWWKYRRPKPVNVPVLDPIHLTRPMETSTRNERQGWVPKNGLSPQPAYSVELPNPEVTIYLSVPIIIYLGYKITEFCLFPPLVFVTP